MKLIYAFMKSVVIFVIGAMNVNALVMPDVTISDHPFVANEDIFRADVDNFLGENEKVAILYAPFGAKQTMKTDLMQDLETGSSFTSSQSDAQELARSGTNTTDYALSAGDLKQNNLNDLADTALAGYADNLGAEKIALDADVLRGSSTVPEPSSIILFTLGLLGLGLMRRQKKCDS